ncbi:hypothetical protein L861_06090 [Litchfieldella anticariensis FP35 = DSM 16096]|uniref:Uncharacterized protein n=1 Tax=Litchfieldella anticariensis (strain DSM 16096 / CECT 5854 / CIP 108499 / LMG 22089 / FP35) TaxID=1121939 RepID=S2KEA1_LITA3|nr:hypothetical protein L861_06090 [Halomonas anticariensis FP35 = DSM 16096]
MDSSGQLLGRACLNIEPKLQAIAILAMDIPKITYVEFHI